MSHAAMLFSISVPAPDFFLKYDDKNTRKLYIKMSLIRLETDMEGEEWHYKYNKHNTQLYLQIRKKSFEMNEQK